MYSSASNTYPPPPPLPHPHRTDSPEANKANAGAAGYAWESGLTGEGIVGAMAKAGFGAR